MEITQNQDARKRYRYGLYSHKLTAPNGASYTRSLIVLRNEYGDIARFTNLHRFAASFAGKVYAPLVSDSKERLYHICSMLNYIFIDYYEKFEIDHIFHINHEALMSFFQSYAYEPASNGRFRSRACIEKCVENTADFFNRLKKFYGNNVLLTAEDIYTEKIVFSVTGRQMIKKIPNFQVKEINQYKGIFRDIPVKVFKILLNLAFRYTPDIAFAICLQAFAWLRAGEVCNVRQEGSPLGSGLIFTKTGSAVKKIEIDITREMKLRSDGVSVGRIKKERKQCVYPPFIEAFCAAYEHHKQFLAGKRFEKDYCPMFISSKGLAMTYRVYQERFYALVDNHLRRELIHSDDSECVIYGQLLYENRLGLHSLRHWFSVQLVLNGEDIAQVQYWRGDSNPESAFTICKLGELSGSETTAVQSAVDAMLDDDIPGSFTESISKDMELRSREDILFDKLRIQSKGGC